MLLLCYESSLGVPDAAVSTGVIVSLCSKMDLLYYGGNPIFPSAKMEARKKKKCG